MNNNLPIVMAFVAGAALAWWVEGLRWDADASKLNESHTGAAAAATVALTGIGLSMTLGGVVSMLTPQPQFNVGSSSSTDNKPNYAFGSPVNTIAMGYPVAVFYGQREIGGAIISAGSFTSDQQ